MQAEIAQIENLAGSTQANSILRQIESPCRTGPSLVDDEFGFNFEGVDTSAAAAQPDRVSKSLEEVAQAPTKADLLKAIWPKELFADATNHDTLNAATQRFLDGVQADSRNHREVSWDSDFSAALHVPKPFAVAAKQMALKHGIHMESFLLAMASNITFLEHHWTRLGAEPCPSAEIVTNCAGPRARDADAQPRVAAAPSITQRSKPGARAQQSARSHRGRECRLPRGARRNGGGPAVRLAMLSLN